MHVPLKEFFLSFRLFGLLRFMEKKLYYFLLTLSSNATHVNSLYSEAFAARVQTIF